MRSRDAMVLALRALIVRVLSNTSVQGDAAQMAEGLSEFDGNGRLIIVVDFEHALVTVEWTR